MSLPERFGVLGNGWDTLAQDFRNEIVDFTHNELGATNECNIYKCESVEDIISNLDISGSVGVHHPLASVEAKASFVKECAKKSSSITLLVKVKRTWRAMIQSATLKKDDNSRAAFKDATSLLKFAGDSYISQVEVGTEYYAAYQFNAFTSKEREKISASIDGKFGALVKVDAKASANIENIREESQTSYTLTQKLVGSDSLLPGAEGIVNFALELTGKDIPNPELLSYKTMRYSSFPGAPSGLSEADNWISAYVDPQPDWYPYSIKAIEQQAQLVLGRSQAVESLYTFYNAGAELQKKLSDHSTACGKVVDEIRKWKFDSVHNSKLGKAGKPPRKPDINLAYLAIPRANFERILGEKWGRQEGGVPWFDFDDEMVYCFGYPKHFRGRGALVLDNLKTVYGCRNPKDPTDPSTETKHEKEHGGAGGMDLEFNHTLSPGQVAFTGLWSKANKVGESDQDFEKYVGLICGFELYIHGNSTSLLMGRKDEPFKGVDVPQNSFFLGFQGRSQYQIDCLQPVYVKFKEPTWAPSLPKADFIA